MRSGVLGFRRCLIKETDKTKAEMHKRTGINLIPYGVRFKRTPMNVTMAILRNIVVPTSSTPERRIFGWKRIVTREYPGKNKTVIIPRIILIGVSANAWINMEAIANTNKINGAIIR